MIHHLDELYKTIYFLGQKIPKRDRFGLHAKIESLCLSALTLVITAAFENRERKKPALHSMRINIEILKRLIRIENELGIIQKEIYINLEIKLQEISKMVNGWIKYLQNQTGGD